MMKAPVPEGVEGFKVARRLLPDAGQALRPTGLLGLDVVRLRIGFGV